LAAAIVVGPNRENFSFADGHRLGDAALFVERDDRTVDVDRVSRVDGQCDVRAGEKDDDRLCESEVHRADGPRQRWQCQAAEE
jgi:hypothetical protein